MTWWMDDAYVLVRRVSWECVNGPQVAGYIGVTMRELQGEEWHASKLVFQ